MGAQVRPYAQVERVRARVSHVVSPRLAEECAVVAEEEAEAVETVGRIRGTDAM
jgi:hypothetical protein